MSRKLRGVPAEETYRAHQGERRLWYMEMTAVVSLPRVSPAEDHFCRSMHGSEILIRCSRRVKTGPHKNSV